jgi:hypothetical protein
VGVSNDERKKFLMGMVIDHNNHILKSHWLDGKWNCHIDHLLYTLVVQMNQYYLNWHKRQIIGFKGLDLADD